MARTTEDRGFQYYPAFLDLRHKRVIVVGAGEVATVKVRGLLPCGPEPLVVIAPEASVFVQEAAAAGRLEWQQRRYQDGDLEGADLAFGATNYRQLNARVADDARRRKVPILAVDDIPNCDFIAPSLVRRGDVIVAISTGGRSPAFARWVRERFDRELPAYWGELLDVAATVRDNLGQRRAQIRPNQWIDALDADLERLVRSGDLDAAKALLETRLTKPTPDAAPTGFVSLVGAGPGDPELLTLRGLRLLQHADAVVHDRLIPPALLDYCRAEAIRYDVGKSPGRHPCRQEEINDLLIRLAQEGKRVVRLKGGDPFVFGRGGEEALALARAGVPFEIVPGVSSALAAPAAAGIPVTHRGLAASVTIATGHPRSESTPGEDHDWAALAATRGTLVFLMAVENLDHIVAQLVANGRSPNEPAAMVQSGTTPEQRVVRASLGEIDAKTREAEIRSPAVLVVGPTAALAEVIGRKGRGSVV